MSRLLEEAGYAARGTTADDHPVRLAAELPADAVVLDVPLEGGGPAWATLEKLHLDPATAHVPVVVCSAAAHAVESYQPTLARRGVRTLPKPFTRDALVAAVGAALGSRRPAASFAPLSPRQREIACLVARGLTNRQVAQVLVTSEGTVANHVRSILLRLALDSRSQLAVWVAKDTLRRSAAGIK